MDESKTDPPPPLPAEKQIKKDGVPEFVSPDGGWGWVIVAAAFCVGIVVDGIVFSFGILLPEILKEFSADKSEVAWVGSCLSGIYLLVGPIVSALANRYSCRVVAIAGSFVASCAFVAAQFATDIMHLIIAYGILGGVGFGLVYLPSIVMVQFYFEKKRAFATGIAVCGSGIGTFIFSPLTQVLIDNYGWRGNMLIQAGIILNCAAFSALFRPLQPVRQVKKKKPKEQTDLNGEKPENGLNFLSNMCHRPKPLLHRIRDARKNQWASDSSIDSIPLNEQDQLMTEEVTSNGHVNVDSANSRTSADQPMLNGLCESENQRLESGDDSVDNNNRVRWASVRGTSDAAENSVIPNGPSVDNVKRDEGNGTVSQMTNGAPPNSCTVMMGNEDHVQEKKGSLKLRKKGSKKDTQPRSPLPKLKTEDLNRPFYRQDIFFSGSLCRISDYETSSSIKKLNTHETDGPHSKSCLCGGHMGDVFKAMLDLSLLKSPTFVILCLAGFLTFMGFFVPFVYLSDFAKSVGVEKEQAAFLLSIIGIANTVGRVFCGWVSDRPNVKAIHINNWSLVLAGATTIALPHCTIYAIQVAYSLIFGLAIACFVSLRSIILVDLLGLDKLTNSFGLTLMFQGTASLIGSPLAGWFYDQTGTYNASFYIAGVMVGVSGLICIPLPRIARWEEERAKKKMAILDESSEEKKKLDTSAV